MPWFRIIDCVKLQKRLPFQPYVFESADILPPILRPEWHADPSQQPSQHMTNLLKQQAIVSAEQENGWRSVATAERMMKGHIPSSLSLANNVFEGKKVILGCQIEVSPDFRVSIESALVNSGGIVLPEERLRDCDIYITPWREGKEYLRVSEHFDLDLKWNINRSYNLHATGYQVWKDCRFSGMDEPHHEGRPAYIAQGQSTSLSGSSRWCTGTERLCKSWSRLRCISTDCSLRRQTISVTNYTGESRDYMKRLIGVMEANFTTTLARESNTHLIAAT